jgi:hypothetical protein
MVHLDQLTPYVVLRREQQKQLKSNHHENRPMGKEGRERSDITSTPNSLKEGLMQHIDPLLGNDHEKNETTVNARQWPTCNNGSTVGSSVFMGLHRGYMTQPTELR